MQRHDNTVGAGRRGNRLLIAAVAALSVLLVAAGAALAVKSRAHSELSSRAEFMQATYKQSAQELIELWCGAASDLSDELHAGAGGDVLKAVLDSRKELLDDLWAVPAAWRNIYTAGQASLPDRDYYEHIYGVMYRLHACLAIEYGQIEPLDAGQRESLAELYGELYKKLCGRNGAYDTAMALDTEPEAFTGAVDSLAPLLSQLESLLDIDSGEGPPGHYGA